MLEPIRKNGILDVPTAVAKGRVEQRHLRGKDVRWLITNRNDEVQLRQLAEGFYEANELIQLAEDVGPRARVLDVGANIGNHSIFFHQHMEARSLTLVEPFARARTHLLANLALNAAEVAHIDLHAVALGARDSRGEIVEPSHFNLGMTRVAETATGDIIVRRGDDLFGEREFDLVKIDVEGSEVEVIDGLEQLLRRCRPAIYVEVGNPLRDIVVDKLIGLGLRLVREKEAYGSQRNLTFAR
ncbi:FkbM family methyltransferase [Sphingomonas glaciei]|uniref:FkbM family methyltransferase n=1 Tax=Sphingomonas glaciei TaxID=2938948 RepID=A0ABY5MVZ0_9SPHN|nr:FkbM family methyltransferase [Sphingomonas glaciei]UUR08423.1 FkbM family methyltransferase [Sphingomonas glaciei]